MCKLKVLFFLPTSLELLRREDTIVTDLALFYVRQIKNNLKFSSLPLEVNVPQNRLLTFCLTHSCLPYFNLSSSKMSNERQISRRYMLYSFNNQVIETIKMRK